VIRPGEVRPAARVLPSRAHKRRWFRPLSPRARTQAAGADATCSAAVCPGHRATRLAGSTPENAVPSDRRFNRSTLARQLGVRRPPCSLPWPRPHSRTPRSSKGSARPDHPGSTPNSAAPAYAGAVRRAGKSATRNYHYETPYCRCNTGSTSTPEPARPSPARAKPGRWRKWYQPRTRAARGYRGGTSPSQCRTKCRCRALRRRPQSVAC